MKIKIPVFFSCDDRYIPFLSVAIKSLMENASDEYLYDIIVLYSGNNALNIEKIQAMQRDNFTIKFKDVSEKLQRLTKNLHLRDYYTISIYFRIFIPSLFPAYKKAIYLDSDVVVLGDISELYFTELGNNLLAGVSDEVIASRKEFIDYAELGVGIKYDRYFNSGMMLMNLELMREMDIEGVFANMLNTYDFKTVCPDQDYLNVICKDRVLYIDKGWNKMALDDSYDGVPKIIHYNNFSKPWLYDNVCYREHFWAYANICPFIEEIKRIRSSFSKADEQRNIDGAMNLVASTIEIVNDENNFAKVLFNGVL